MANDSSNGTPQTQTPNANAMPADVQSYLSAQQQGTHTSNPAAPAMPPQPTSAHAPAAAPAAGAAPTANPNAMPADVQQYLSQQSGAAGKPTPPPTNESQPGFLDRFEQTLGLKDYMQQAEQKAQLDIQFKTQIEKAVKSHNWPLAAKLAAQRMSHEAISGMIGPAGALVQSAPGVAASSVQHVKNAVGNAKSGNYAQASDEAGQAVPLVGPLAEQTVAPTAQDIGNKNLPGLAGDAAGVGSQLLLGMIGGGEGEAEEAANAAAKSRLPARSAADISSGLYSEEADHIATALGTGNKKINVPHEVNKVLPEIREGVADVGGTPKDFQKGQIFGKGAGTSHEASAAARRSSATTLRRGVNRAIDIHEMRVQPLIDHVSTDVVPDAVWEKNPALRQEFAEELEQGKKITYGDVNAKRVELNKGIGRSNFYGKTPSGKMNVAPNAEHAVEAAEQSRDALYGHIKEQTGVDVRPIKQRESSLIKLHDMAQAQENTLSSKMAEHNSASAVQKFGQTLKYPFKAHSAVADAEGFVPPDFWFNRHVRLGLGDFDTNPVTNNSRLIKPPDYGLKLTPPEGSAAPGAGAQEHMPFNEGFSQDMQTSPNENIQLTPPNGRMEPAAQRPLSFHENPESVYPSTEPGGESPQPKPVKTNGSGESAASQEAMNRKTSDKANGTTYYKVDTRMPDRKTSLGANVNPSDLTPGEHEAIIKVNKDGSEEVLSQGNKAKALPAKQPPKKPAARATAKPAMSDKDIEAQQNAALKQASAGSMRDVDYFHQAAEEIGRKTGKRYDELTTAERSQVSQRAQELKDAAKASSGKQLRNNLKDVIKKANLG